MGRRVRYQGRAAGVSAAGIATACDCRENGYPVVTRRKETRELLGKGHTVGRFGTKRPLVRIQLALSEAFADGKAESMGRPDQKTRVHGCERCVGCQRERRLGRPGLLLFTPLAGDCWRHGYESLDGPFNSAGVTNGCCV